MAHLSFATYDVFTSKPYAGNPLAIVENADELTTAQMQTIAREFNLSETIFVNRPQDPANTASVRIFFPTAEIPFAGHPTVGCAIHLACKAHGTEDFETEIRLEEVAGLVPVRVSRRDGHVSAEFKAPVLPHDRKGDVLRDKLAAALGLKETDIGFGGHVPSILAGGPAFLYVPVGNRAALRSARPLEPAWSEVLAAGNVDSAYLYCTSETGFSARMFAPTAGIPEDPATGSAAAIFAAQLLKAGALQEGEQNIAILQGEDMGRPSDIALRIDVKNGAIGAVYVSGSAVPLMTGRLNPPGEN